MASRFLRAAFTVLAVLIAFLLQTSFFGAIPLIRTTPNLLLVVTVVFGLFRGRTTGLIVGFSAGLLYDAFGGDVLGEYALVLALLGYGCGRFTPYFDFEYVTLPMAVCAVCDLIYGLYVYVFGFLFRGRWNLLFYLRAVILPEMVYTVVVLLIVYRFLLFVDRSLDRRADRRSSDTFG